MRTLLTILLISLSSALFGQQKEDAEKFIAEGNKKYMKGEYSASKESYKKALEKDPTNYRARFNQANSLYREKDYEKAVDEFEGLTASAPSEQDKARAFHNLGNSYLQQKKYKESIEAYKNALRINPGDEESRYNLAYAKRMQKEQDKQDQQQQQDQQNQNQDQQQDQQDQQEQDQKEQNQDQQNQDQNENGEGEDDQEKNDQQQQGKQPRPNELTKEQAKRMLEAMGDKEKKNLNKLDKKEGKAVKTESGKKW